MNRLNKTESAVFLYCKFSLFLKARFSTFFDNLDESSASTFYTPVKCQLLHLGLTLLRIEIHKLSFHWIMKNISYFNVCEA